MYPLLQLHTTSSDIEKSNESLNYYNDIKNPAMD